MAQVTAICRLCGETKLLTFEHVPPRAAFNEFPRFHFNTKEFFANRYQAGPAPTVIDDPRGAGAYTLCGDCNGRCARYAIHFIEWAVFWQSALDANPMAGALTATHRTRRSRVLKQIAAMMLSASPPKTGELNPALRKFVWNAQEKGLPDDIRVYAALTRDKDARQAGGSGAIKDGVPSIYSEVAFAPLILVLTLGGTASPDPRLVDITYFAGASYTAKDDTQLTLPVLGLRGYLPGAYV